MASVSKEVSVGDEPVHSGQGGLRQDSAAPEKISLATSKASARSSGGPSKNLGWQQQRDRLRQHVVQNPIEGISQEELDAHFDGMPSRYWEQIEESELAWGLQNIHRFLYGVVASPTADTPVVVNWRYFPEQGYTKILVCTWDRLGLLAKVAAYISALRLNVVRADVYTRADNLVLDSFWLCNAEQEHVSDPERLQQFVFLLEGGLSESPSFASTWALETHKFLPRTKRIAPAVAFNNVDSPEHTILTVEASERPGLLHDMLQVLSDHKLNISEALIDTVDDAAHDIFFVTDEHKKKVLAEDRLKKIERALIEAAM
jgi:[protein-PII] uridylyltransferase